MILANDDILTIKLTSAATTNELQWIVTAFDQPTADFAFIQNMGETDGTNPVEMLTASTSVRRREIRYISVPNTDTITQTVELLINTTRVQYVTLAVNSTLFYDYANGWKVITSDGSTPGSGTTAQNTYKQTFLLMGA